MAQNSCINYTTIYNKVRVHYKRKKRKRVPQKKIEKFIQFICMYQKKVFTLHHEKQNKVLINKEKHYERFNRKYLLYMHNHLHYWPYH